MMLKDFEGNVSPAKGAVCVELTIGSKTLPQLCLSSTEKARTIYYLGETGFMPTVVSLLRCINALFNG